MTFLFTLRNETRDVDFSHFSLKIRIWFFYPKRFLILFPVPDVDGFCGLNGSEFRKSKKVQINGSGIRIIALDLFCKIYSKSINPFFESPLFISFASVAPESTKISKRCQFWDHIYCPVKIQGNTILFLLLKITINLYIETKQSLSLSSKLIVLTY